MKASEVDIHVDGQVLTLHVNPYFLRLTFSNRLIEDDDSSAQYDASHGYLNVVLAKEVPGEVFEDLDLLARLLAPSTADGSGIRRAPIGHASTSNVLEASTPVDNGLAGLSLDTSISSAWPSSPVHSQPLIEVLSTSNSESVLGDSVPSANSFNPSEEMLKEREILLEGTLLRRTFPSLDIQLACYSGQERLAASANRAFG